MITDEEKTGIGNKEKSADGIGMTLFGLYIVFLFLAIIIAGRIIYIQIFYTPENVYVEKFTPSSRKVVTEPERGAILSCDGRVLAASTPKYQIGMDCTVRKEEYRKLDDRKEGERLEAEWMAKARKLAAGLSEIYQDRTADEYYRLIAENRRNGKQYVRIGGLIDHDKLQKVKALPLFDEGGYKGGIIIEKFDKRIYPYGSLARRVLGHLDDNNPNNDDVGIEGKYDYVLHGREGVEWLRKTDNREYIRDYDSTYVEVENGKDVRTTLDIDIQDIAEKALAHSKIILLHSMEEAVEMSNEYAPEHLIIQAANYRELGGRVTNAGSVFLGALTPESAGDYASGTNHTLPTNGYAKAYSGVSVETFLKKITFQEITPEGLKQIGPAIEVMAAAEQLDAHKNAITLRLEELGRHL